MRAKKSSYETWEKKVADITRTILHSMESYYLRKSLVLNEILLSRLTIREQRNPLVDIRTCTNRVMEDIVLSSWVFPTIPGTASQNWPEGLEELTERLATLPLPKLWCEPFDLEGVMRDNGERWIRDAIVEWTEGFKRGGNDKLIDIEQNIGRAILALFQIDILSADYDRIVLIDFILYTIDYIYIYIYLDLEVESYVRVRIMEGGGGVHR